ncbi:hypothetical protein PS914_06092 [Pseudomonas fluorescens]|uniref:hypothetical protein n=1 Tax=Pseudomonas fluorescens TaxID=294 RepID=UPI001240A7B6|nr:hypothetical protein [Pseudomonas fluorescens]VVQ17916.1 hypothetical protein PS914_06092 [Pseudomonas fluorescens]
MRMNCRSESDHFVFKEGPFADKSDRRTARSYKDTTNPVGASGAAIRLAREEAISHPTKTKAITVSLS